MVVLPVLEIALRRAAGVGIPGAGPIVQHLVLVGWLPRGRHRRARRPAACPGDGRLRAGRCAAPRRGRLHGRRCLGRGDRPRVGRGRADPVGARDRLDSRRGHSDVGRPARPSCRLRAHCRAPGVAVEPSMERPPVRVDRHRGRPLLLARNPSLLNGVPAWPGVAIVIVAGALGAPIFAILGGAAALLFMSDGITPAAILIETYALSVSPTLPAIPLFTLAGFLLAEGQRFGPVCCACSARSFGWIPGGTAVVCAFLCSFFTVFTGGSGVTILALGGVLFPALLKDGYRERFALGLLTASGSLGLLLPPSLPLILYGVVAQIPIEDLFIGGILPGLLLTAMMAAWGVREGVVSGAGRQPVRGRAKRFAALWAAKWELALPVVVLVAMFSGIATAVEAAALTACYALFAQTVIHRDVSIRERSPARARRVCRTDWRRSRHSRCRGRLDQLDGRRADPVAPRRVHARPHRFAVHVSPRVEPVPAGGRLPHGDLSGHRRGGAAHPPARGRVRDSSRASGHHLRREPRARVT